MANEAEKRLDVISQADSETTAGNYFVSNYPPYSLWTADRTSEALDQLDCPGSAERPLGLYVHIPFCRKRCHFCYFRIYTDKNKDDIRGYLDAVIDELAMLAKRPFLSDRKLNFIYFGGGTPSYLSQKQLEYLVQGLQRSLPWDAAQEVAFECEPGTLNKHKLQAICDLGVTRLSLGIENFDDDILKLNNRAHQSNEVYRAYEWAQMAGFNQINIDLIAGMLGETDTNWHRCIDRTLKLQPDAITIYQMEIPYNTTIYQQMQAGQQDAAPVADWSTKRRWVAEAFTALESAGYTVSSAYTAIKNQCSTNFVYRDALWAGADMFGIGVSSFGHLAGVHYQNQHNFVPYISAINDKKLPIYRAISMTDEEQMIRQFILQLKLGRISRKPFIDRFGIDVFDRWHNVLRNYQDEGYLTFDSHELTLTRDGLLRVDQLLHQFFLPEHRGVRYA